MNDETHQAHADLAFLKGLTETGGRPQAMFGLLYALSGVLYGAHAFIGWLQAVGVVTMGDAGNLWLTVGVNVAFFLILGWGLWAGRKEASYGVVTRAINAAFAAAGLANLSMVIVFACAAFQLKDLNVWLLYVPVVFALQGAAWFIAALLRRRGWQFVVALGWYIAAALLGVLWRTDAWILTTALSLFLLMGVPGVVMMRLSRKAG